MIARLLSRIFVRPFYRENTGFFLLVLVVAFLLFRPRDHVALALAFHRHPTVCLVYAVLWTLYGLKWLAFLATRLPRTELDFLLHLRLFSRSLQWREWGRVSAYGLLPISAYGGMVIFQGIRHNHWGSSFLALGILVCLHLAGLALPVWMQHDPGRTGVSRFFPAFRLRSAQPWVWPAFFYLRENARVLLSVKAFSLAVLVGVCALYQTDTYDDRLLSLGLGLVLLAHLSLPGFWLEEQKTTLLWMGNMPLSLRRKWGNRLLVAGLMMSPEVLVLLRNLPDGVSPVYLAEAGLLFGFGYAGLERLCRRYPDLWNEKPGWVAAGFFVYSLGVMAGVSVGVGAGVLLVLPGLWPGHPRK